MDFASLMKKQIDKAKPAPTTSDASTKYLKRSEIEAQRQAAYRAEQAAAEAAKAERLEKKRKRDEEDAEAARAREEKKRKLVEEAKRLREEEEAEAERARRKRLGLKEKKEVVEEEVKTDEALVPKTVYPGAIPTTLEPVEEKDMKVQLIAGKACKSEEERQMLFRQLASYFNMVLRSWDTALAQRSVEVKTSFQGKQAHGAMVQAKENLRPLYKKMESGDVPDDILKPVVEIVHAAQERKYVDANNGYLRLSIGNAAWPIGVTMVGIHERSAREKLHDGNTAHIMSDETTRKYLQSIKRCLSFAQTRWPPDDQLQLMG